MEVKNGTQGVTLPQRPEEVKKTGDEYLPVGSVVQAEGEAGAKPGGGACLLALRTAGSNSSENMVAEGIMGEGVGPQCLRPHGHGKNLDFYSLCDEKSLKNFIQGNAMI